MGNASSQETKPVFNKYLRQQMYKTANAARDLYKDPSTAMIPELDQWTQQGINQRAQIAGSGNTVGSAGSAEAMKTLGGGYLDLASNPAWQRNMESAMGAASDRFAGSGRVGSGAYAGALGDAATGVTAQMFDVERGRQMQALGSLPQLIMAQYGDAAALEDAGRAIDEDNMARFDWPYARLDRWANTLYGNPMANTPGQRSQSPFSWGGAAANFGMGLAHPLSTLGGSK